MSKNIQDEEKKMPKRLSLKDILHFELSSKRDLVVLGHTEKHNFSFLILLYGVRRNLENI